MLVCSTALMKMTASFFFHITSTSGCILYNSCDETRVPAYSGTTVEIIREESQRRTLTMAEQGLNVIYHQTTTTCFNGDQKISQPCNGGQGTGCSYDACMEHCFDEDDCEFFFHITSTSGCILYNSCDEIRTPAYSGTTVEVTRPSASPTQAPTGLNVVFYETKLTCSNGDQKISQPCNGGKGTGCSYDACMEHCFDEPNCKFFFHITSTSGCILYNSCDETRTPAYSGTTVEVADLNVVYDRTQLTCFNGEQKISQPCNGGTGTGCNTVLMKMTASFSFTSLRHQGASFTTAAM